MQRQGGRKWLKTDPWFDKVSCWVLWLHTGQLLTILVPRVVRVAFPWIECLFRYIHQMLYLCYVAVTGVHGHPTYQKPQAIGLFLKAFVITFTSKS